MKRLLACLASCALWLPLGACGEDGELTEIVVVVDSDVPELTRVSLEIEGFGGGDPIDVDLEEQALPRTLGLVWKGGELGPIAVTASGFVDGEAEALLSERRSNVFFERGKTLELRIDLLSACVGLCEATEACVRDGRGVECVSSDDATVLREWTGDVVGLPAGGGEPGDAGGAGDGGDTGDGAMGDGGPGDVGPPDAGSDAAMTCDEICAFDVAEPHAELTCDGEVCGASCDDGHGDCDGDYENGCEAPLDSAANCGGCASEDSAHDCSELPSVASASCDSDACVIDGCESGFADCNDDPDDGCERDLSADGPCCDPLLDTDSDGVDDCADGCPLDVGHVTAPHCGCPSRPAPAGTACGDGLCEANATCDGDGRCGDPADCAPAAGCSFARYVGQTGSGYYVCPGAETWDDARAACRSAPGMDLVRIDDAAEDAFIGGVASGSLWLGGTDAANEDEWLWADNGDQFWEEDGDYRTCADGSQCDTSPPGLYTNWVSGQPGDFLQDCLEYVTADGGWHDAACDDSMAFVCEVVADACPNHPKLLPGVCGCAAGDDDSDGDGTEDCNDACPTDAAKIAPGQCGCGVADDDGDSDGTADCDDDCPADADKTLPGLCGCGVADTDSDGDGTPDCDDDCPGDIAKLAPGLCGCGIADTDRDNDGTPDCLDMCPDNAPKTEPGQCGCSLADTDTDGDGTANCLDMCPTDAPKIAPGQCGCAVPDTDSDGDGTADCDDMCPLDPHKLAPDTCGCIGEEGNAAVDTPCVDATCMLNTACDGEGTCGVTGACDAPDASCGTIQVFGGHRYWFCTAGMTWDEALAACGAVGMSLVRIDDASEDAFVAGAIVADTWLGGRDATEGVWVWADGGDQFWQGGSGGYRTCADGTQCDTSPPGLYTNWNGSQPNDSFGQDCLEYNVSGDGPWNDASCSGDRDFACESPGP